MGRRGIRGFRRGSAHGAGRRPAALGWRRALRAAAAIARDRPGLVAVGLLGFLARGGAVAFVLPIVVLPTPTGISNFVGSQALTAEGPSQGLIWLIATALAGVVALILVGTVIGAAVDLLLLRHAFAFLRARERTAAGAVSGATPAPEPSLVVSPTLLLRATIVRLVWMLPVAVAAVWGTSRLVAAAYHQLILPDDLAVPLALRILRDALDAAAVVIATWLASETLAGLAVRRLVVSGGSIAGALAWALVAPIRRPITTVATLALGTAGVVVALTPPVLLANVLWRQLQVLLDGNQPASLTFVTTAGFVAAWGLGLLLVGVLATWRSLAWSLEVLRAGRRAELAATAERPADPPSIDRPSLDQPLEQPLAAGGHAG